MRDALSETYDAVLFDMDGTLLDSTPAVLRSWTRWAGEFGVTLEALTSIDTHGRPARDIVADVVAPDLVDRAHARITELEIADVDGVDPLPGADALLRDAAERAAVVTSCSRPLADARLRAAGLVPPAVVVTTDDITRGKPDPEPFLLAARRLGAAPQRCLVVEDAPAGLRSGRAAGAALLAVTTTHDSTELDADLVVTDLSRVELLATPDGLSLRTT